MCNISYLSDSQDHIHDSERDHETALSDYVNVHGHYQDCHTLLVVTAIT